MDRPAALSSPTMGRRTPYSQRMLTLSTLVPVAAGLFVAGHVLVSAYSAKRERAFRTQTAITVEAEAEERFSGGRAGSSEWQRAETERRLKAKGYDPYPASATYAAVQAAAATDRGTLSTGQQVDQWILIASAVAGVVLMGLGL